MVKEDATALSQWAKGLYLESANNTFFNFTASHDGIGVRPLEGILDPAELEGLIEIVKVNAGQVSYKQNPDGSESPYELNITYVDAILADPSSTRADKFLASQSIQYALPGVPATYIHSLLGSRNWVQGVKQTGRARTINREKLPVDKLISQLNEPESFRARVFFPYLNLIKTRKKQSALTNISSKTISVSLAGTVSTDQASDLITGTTVNTAAFDLNPYQYMWLEEKSQKI